MEVKKASLKDFLVARYVFDRRRYQNVSRLRADIAQEIEDFGFAVNTCRERHQKLLTELHCINAEMEMLKYLIEQYFPEARKDIVIKDQFDVSKEQFDAYKNATSQGDWEFVANNPLCTQSDIMYIMEHFDELEEVFGD